MSLPCAHLTATLTPLLTAGRLGKCLHPTKLSATVYYHSQTSFLLLQTTLLILPHCPSCREFPPRTFAWCYLSLLSKPMFSSAVFGLPFYSSWPQKRSTLSVFVDSVPTILASVSPIPPLAFKIDTKLLKEKEHAFSCLCYSAKILIKLYRIKSSTTSFLNLNISVQSWACSVKDKLLRVVTQVAPEMQLKRVLAKLIPLGRQSPWPWHFWAVVTLQEPDPICTRKCSFLALPCKMQTKTVCWCFSGCLEGWPFLWLSMRN